MDTTSEAVVQVVGLLQAGHNQRQVARKLNMSQSAVSRVYRRFQETGGFVRRPQTNRHRSTSETDDRFTVSASLRNRYLTDVDVQQELRRVRGVVVTVKPDFNLLVNTSIGLLSKWSSILFTDESRMCLHGNDRRDRVYRRPGERFSQCCFAETVSYGGGSVIVWAGISYEGKTELVFVPSGGRSDGLTAQKYVGNILLDHVVPYAGYIGEDFLLIHDNARCHTASVTRQFLQ
ncbi:uncharacterized protein LOC123667568 [Melitaea cinxia]|uniref:uncharacterized protein LOC123667568 n=1 Tax=Melitaea cinxia TaxID=113334 RepID=UPI001E27059B|nr:uncharacterized protein LOC123667568 [Melitaea cinxia]